jgi:sulfide:quinone oxidoreductase
MQTHYQVLIIGGGTAGLTVAAHLLNHYHRPTVAIIEPASKHYYQPLWTLVGGGVFAKEASERDEAEFIPFGASWIQDYVTGFDPDNNAVTLKGGDRLTYDYLIVAAGIQVDWDKIKGLKGNVGKNGICSNYSYDTVDSTWENIRNFKGGTALFTQPSSPIKCGGAPQKIAYLAEDHFNRTGVRRRSDVIFMSGTGGIFSVKKYADALTKIVERKGMKTAFQRELIEVRPDKKEAVFQHLTNGKQEEVVSYEMLHVTPPMSAPNFIKESQLAAASGWVDVDKLTLQHVRYPNVFALGDCSSLPTSKTGAAIRKQAPVVAANVMASIQSLPMTATYDGYTSCPLVTGYGSLILAEFDYNFQPKESFPFDQSKERYSMYALKAYGLPAMYWNGMLRGRM